MANKLSQKEKEERLLILAVDVDNDLHRKTGISGPLTGKVQILNGANQLALADPEDPDSNTMFFAVKLYDEMKEEGYQVSVACITGSEAEGYSADREVARQLELVLDSNKSDGCIFVTDGASDDRTLPIVESRIKVNSVRSVKMKQAETIENTYFAILEKLKEPHYSRIVFGLPAVLLLLFAVSYLMGISLVLPVILIGVYLLLKGFGLEDSFINSFKGFSFSIDRMSFVFYLSSILFLVASLFIAVGNYGSKYQVTSNQALSIASMVQGFLILLPIVMILFLIGRILDVREKKYMFRTFKYGIYIGSSIILWVLVYSFTSWIIGQIYFSELMNSLIIAIVIGVAVSVSATLLRIRAISTKKIKGKMVVNELGAMIGKIGGVDVRRGKMVINTSFGNPITYSIDRIVELSDKVVVK
ncbi:MAG: DUF373 family protein [Candidatus Micrarchaeota archaeon]|nr:DUF373 family protein [Candidatus Micrarchaeota archaeon]MDE1850145.1 DUF373 family protein [Candidatus Micrarchaeota archaeon]